MGLAMQQLRGPLVVSSLLASPAFADGLTVQKDYSFHPESTAKRDTACIMAFAAHVAPEFRGLTSLRLSMPTMAATQSGALATYPSVTYGRVYGDVWGSLSCVFSQTSDTPTDVSVSFGGEGLGGFEKRGRIAKSNDPADWTVTSFSTQVRP